MLYIKFRKSKYKWLKIFIIFFLVLSYLIPNWPSIDDPFFNIQNARADTTNLVVTSCEVQDVNDVTCYNAISTDGSTSDSITKGEHIDAPFQTLSASAVNSATLYYDSWGTLSGTWGIYVKDSRDGTTICSVDPAPEDGGETQNSTDCSSITTTQLSNGVWLQVNNEDTRGPEVINLDYVRLYVDYTAAATPSVTITTDGSVAFGTVALSSEQDTTATGTDDTEVAQNNGTATENFNIKTSNATGGTQWSVGASAGSDTCVVSFSTNDGGAWEVLQTVDTYETLATSVSASGNVNVDLKIGTPTLTTDYQEKTITITIQAVIP